jgi:hypothetical protein
MIDRRSHTVTVPDPPRVVSRWFYLRRMRAMAFCGLLFAGLGVALGVGIPAVFCVSGDGISPLVDWKLDQRHASTSGVIVDKQLKTNIHINSRHPWRIAFEFATPDGASVEAVGHSLDPSFADRVSGDPIEVEYDPADPSRARPAGGSASLLPLRMFWVISAPMGAMLLVGLGLLIAMALRARDELGLLTYGAGAQAEVVRVQRVRSIRFGAHHPYDVYYRFRDHAGREVLGKDRTYHYAWAEALAPGDRVGVVYHPQSSGASVLWLHGGDIRPGG